MTVLDRYVEKLNVGDVHTMIRNWKEFQAQGYIGSCTLRSKAVEFLNENEIVEGYVTYWMERMTMACLIRLYEATYRD